MVEEGCRLGIGYRGWEGDERTMKKRKIMIEKEREYLYQVGCIRYMD